MKKKLNIKKIETKLNKKTKQNIEKSIIYNNQKT